PFSRTRFDTMFFVSELEQPESPDVWPGELSSGEWVEPDRALRLWEEDRVTLAMPTLHAIRVIGEGADDLPARLRAVPEANGVPSRHVILHPGVLMVALHTPGHSRSHIAFFEERSRTLCAGDLVSTLGTVVVDPPDGNMSDYLRSLDRLRELQATALIPGHGPPSRGVDHLLAALLEH